MFTKVSPGTGCRPWASSEGGRKGRALSRLCWRGPRAPPQVSAVHAMCVFHQQRPPHSSQTCHPSLPQARWALISPLGPPSQSSWWAGHLQMGRGRQCRLAQRAWAQFTSLALGICRSLATLTVGGWVSVATGCSLPLSAPGPVAALVLSPPLGSPGSCSGFGELLEVIYFFSLGPGS